MGLPKKTKAFSFCKFYKGFRDPRRERYLRPVLLHIGELVQIVVDNQMIVPVQGRQSGLWIRQIELIAGRVLAGLLHRSEKNRIVLFFRAQRIVPLLNKQDGGFCSCMRLENIYMQADDSENAAALCNIFPERPIGAVIESALRQNDSHASARLQEVQVALNKEDIPADLVLPFSDWAPAQLISGDNCIFLDIPGKRRVGHNEIELEPAIIAAVFRLQLL